MANLKAPLLSLGAQGRLGQVLSYDSAPGHPRVRKITKPFDPNTDLQRWHRHIYQMLVQQWRSLTEAQKATYKAPSYLRPLPNFAYFMRTELRAAKDILAYWPLDETQGTVAQDFSSFQRHADIVSALHTDGLFNNALLFDGTAGYLNCYTPPEFDNLQDWTLMLYIYPTDLDGHMIFHKGIYPKYCWLEAGGTQLTAIILFDTTNARATTLAMPPLNAWTHLTIKYASSDRYLRLYYDGAEQAYSSHIQGVGTPQNDAPFNLTIGSTDAAYTFKGKKDEIILWRTAVADARIARYAHRTK